MADMTILTITADERFLEVLRDQLHHRNADGGNRMIVAGTIEEACSLLPMAHPRLIVVHWTHHGSHLEELNRLLWATSVLARRVPVLVIADQYRTEQATTLYRMGVTEYVSRTHHVGQFGRILDAYLGRSRAPRSRRASAPADPEPPQSIKPWATAAIGGLKVQVV
ncbi:MAG: response regulator [Isosphaeraceae bacterium]